MVKYPNAASGIKKMFLSRMVGIIGVVLAFIPSIGPFFTLVCAIAATIFNVWGILEASKDHNQALECIPPEYIGLVASPLTARRIDPDVCVLYLKPTQAFLLLAGYQFDEYEKLSFSFVGESTCSDSWCKTFLTGKPGLALPCYADKKFAGVGDDELRLTFTPDGLVRADGLQKMYKTGLRYPIAPYSITTDILDGLPKHYMEY